MLRDLLEQDLSPVQGTKGLGWGWLAQGHIADACGREEGTVASVGVGLSSWEETGKVVGRVRLKGHGGLKREGWVRKALEVLQQRSTEIKLQDASCSCFPLPTFPGSFWVSARPPGPSGVCVKVTAKGELKDSEKIRKSLHQGSLERVRGCAEVQQDVVALQRQGTKREKKDFTRLQGLGM